MRNLRAASILLLALALVTAGASAQDFSNYVAVGDSLTAGYASGGLAQMYQQHSYPSILAGQFGMASFAQPIVSDPGIPAVLELQALHVTSQGISPVIGAKSGQGQPLNAEYAGIYNNLGIPGATANTLITKTGNIMNLLNGTATSATVMYDIVLRDGVHTALEQAIGAGGTFYTIWAGNNDVLNAALSGVAMDGVTLTTVASFTQSYQTLVGGIRQMLPNATIVTVNIPDVASIPFVTTVKPYLVNPADGSHIPLIGSNGLLTENDYVTLGAASLIAQGIGVPAAAGGTGLPLPEGSVDATGLHAGVVLRAAEVDAIRARTQELNGVIAATSAALGADMWDVNAFFSKVKAEGITYGGMSLSSDFLTGGLFSYDGVHPQSVGYAMVANELVKFINQTYGTDVPEVDLRPYLLGSASATSVAAAQARMTLEAYRALVHNLVPDALLDDLTVTRTVRGRVGGRR